MGKVYLVGAGPGDPELLTVKAARLIASAELVVFDRLVSDAVLDMISPTARMVDVGKQTGRHSVPQDAINALLVDLAAQGNDVVRLKGGDPFIFGRGGEEAEALANAGIAFEVVPGITAACGAASYAGIPLTHRDYAQSCLFVTGHVKEGGGEMDWAALARPHQTLAIYMGLSMLPSICVRLVESGLSPCMPAAAIEQGTLPGQRVIAATLSTLAAEVAAAGLRSPCLTVVGEVVRLRDQLAWFDAPAMQPHESNLAFTTGA